MSGRTSDLLKEKQRKLRARDWADPDFFLLSSSQDRKRPLLSRFRSRKGQRTRLTRSGFVLCLLSVAIGTAAYNTAGNILYLTLALMLSSLLLSGVLSWMNFRRVECRLILDPHMRVGQPAAVGVEVKSAKQWLPSFGLWFNVTAHQHSAGMVLPLEGTLGAGEKQVLQWIFDPTQRGREVIEVVSTGSLFPFGFLRKSITGGGPLGDVLVWPAQIDYEFLPSSKGQPARQGAVAPRRGSGAELVGLRPYRYGDLVRQVHWKASARTRRLLVRETADEQNESFAIWVSAPHSVWGSAEKGFESMCSLAGSLAEDLFLQGKLAALGVAPAALWPVRRLADVHTFLDQLSTLEMQQGKLLSPATPYPLVTFSPGAGGHVTVLVNGHSSGQA